MEARDKLTRAMEGDINAFHYLFSEFKPELKSFLYRLLLDRFIVEDFYHDTFIKAFDKLKTFQQKSSLKTWCFSMASNMCLDYLRKKKRWSVTQKEDIKALAEDSPAIQKSFLNYQKSSYEGEFEMREHIDYCFSCLAKTIAVEKQVAIILKDIYDFKVKEVATILDLGYANVKKMLRTGRKSLDTIFNQKCALVNRNGVCHQCTELNGAFNPRQKESEQLQKVKMVQESKNGKKANLYKLRTELIKNIDPFTSNGANLHNYFIDVARYHAGEITESPYF